jgi:hypothetical protein
VGSEEEAQDLETRLRAEGGEALGGAGDEQRIGLAHVSIVAEIWKHVKLFLLRNVFRRARILGTEPGSGNAQGFDF